jgi:hypothetical protein
MVRIHRHAPGSSATPSDLICTYASSHCSLRRRPAAGTAHSRNCQGPYPSGRSRRGTPVEASTESAGTTSWHPPGGRSWHITLPSARSTDPPADDGGRHRLVCMPARSAARRWTGAADRLTPPERAPSTYAWSVNATRCRRRTISIWASRSAAGSTWSGFPGSGLLDPTSAPSLGAPGPAVCGQRQPQAHPDQPEANDPPESGSRLPGAGPPARPASRARARSP